VHSELCKFFSLAQLVCHFSTVHSIQKISIDPYLSTGVSSCQLIAKGAPCQFEPITIGNVNSAEKAKVSYMHARRPRRRGPILQTHVGQRQMKVAKMREFSPRKNFQINTTPRISSFPQIGRKNSNKSKCGKLMN